MLLLPRHELLIAVFCIVVSTLAAVEVALSLGTADEYYLENRTDPLIFRAAGELLKEGKSPYLVENLVDNITRQRFEGRQPPCL